MFWKYGKNRLKKTFAAASLGAVVLLTGGYAAHRSLNHPTAWASSGSPAYNANPTTRYCTEQIHRNKALLLAAEDGHLDVVEALLKDGADIHTSDDQALRAAVYNGNVAMVQTLIRRGADVNVIGGAPLIRASEDGDTQIVALLIAGGANVNTLQGAALIMASRNGHAETVETLVRNGASAGLAEAKAQAARYGHDDVIRLLTTAKMAKRSPWANPGPGR